MNDNVRMHLLCKLWVLLCAAKWVKIGWERGETISGEKRGGGGVGELFFHLLARGEGELEKCTSFGFSSCPCPINNEQFLSMKSFLGFVSCLFVVFGVEWSACL